MAAGGDSRRGRERPSWGESLPTLVQGASPVILRVLGAALGAVLVVAAAGSVIGTVIVPRAFTSRLTAGADWLVARVFHGLERLVTDTQRRDAVLAGRAAAMLLMQLVVWLLTLLVGFALMLLPFTGHGPGSTLTEAASAMSTLGFSRPENAASTAIAVVAAFASLGTLALQIGYLPALYSAYNRRETSVALLNARAGMPTWGPELLARTISGWAPEPPPWGRCRTSTRNGSAGPPTSPRATGPTCR